ncbi:MAG: hypothetical protein ACRDZV_00285 [Acidimicrobiia bacterium]
MRTRAGLLTVALVAITVLTASPATADDEDAGAYIDDNENPTAVARDVGRRTSESSAGPSDCKWSVVIEDDFAYAVHEINGLRLFSETGRWLQKICNGQSISVNGSYLIAEGAQVDPAELATEARRSIPIISPAINTSPASDRRLYARVPTWLWLDPSWWQPYTATASAGRVSSTVTARPVRAVWSAGDGGGTTCDGPGVVWREGMREDATYCRYTYYHSSAGEEGGTYTLSVTVEFEVTWTSNVGVSGGLAGVSRSASRPVEVGEIQAVESE